MRLELLHLLPVLGVRVNGLSAELQAAGSRIDVNVVRCVVVVSTFEQLRVG